MPWFYTAVKCALQTRGYKVYLSKAETLPGGVYQESMKGFDAVVLLPKEHDKYIQEEFYVAEIKTHQEIQDCNFTDENNTSFTKLRSYYKRIYTKCKILGNFCIAITGQAEKYYYLLTNDCKVGKNKIEYLKGKLKVKDKNSYPDRPKKFLEEIPDNQYTTPKRMFIIDSIDKKEFEKAAKIVDANIVWLGDYKLPKPLNYLKCTVYIYKKSIDAKWPKWYDYNEDNK